MAYGSGYTLALLLMLVGFAGLSRRSRDAQDRLHTKGYWIVLLGLCMVIPGDAIHTWTWHQNGLTTPTPGTNPVANTAYAVHMMGINLVMAGAMTVGVAADRAMRDANAGITVRDIERKGRGTLEFRVIDYRTDSSGDGLAWVRAGGRACRPR